MNVVPAIQVPDGRTFSRVPTFMTEPRGTELQIDPWLNPELPRLEPFDAGSGSILGVIDQQLHQNVIKTPKPTEREFWPPKLFNHIFTEAVVHQIVTELVKLGKLPVNEGSNQNSAIEYWAGAVCGNGSSESSYRQLFAIWLLIGEAECIQHFIKSNLTDKMMPLDEESLSTLGFSWNQTNLFKLYQRMLKVPFLAPKRNKGGLCQVVFEVDDIEPWYKMHTAPQKSSSSQTSNSISGTEAQLAGLSLAGGYGDVYQIYIHPWQHDFHETLKSVRLLWPHMSQ